MRYAAVALALIAIVVLILGIFNIDNSATLAITEIIIGLVLLAGAVLYYYRGR